MTSTIGDIMDAMVMPPADVLWAAGIEDDAPRTDEAWAKVRRSAITLLEASDLLVLPGRHAVKADDKSPTPASQLTPEQIDALISKDRASWTRFAQKMHDAAMVAL